MSISDIRAQLELEFAWRRDEIRHLHNKLMADVDEPQRRLLRRPMILMLYAHYEGFVAVVLQAYVAYVNQQGISCHQVTEAVLAGSWSSVFAAMESGDKKAEFFKNSLPNDIALHRFARRREFVEQLDGFLSRDVSLSDDVVDTESNLWPVVFRKNLYKLGLDFSSLDAFDGSISELLNRRNEIAHGALS